MAQGPALNVVVPLGGLGSRFQKEGFHTRPKPFIRVLGKEMLLWVLDHLNIRADDSLTLVFNPAWMSMDVYMREIVAERFPRAHLVQLPGPTRGAAETVLIGLRGLPADVRRRPTLLADGDCFYDGCDVVGLFRSQAARGMGAVMVFNDTQPRPIYSYCNVDREMVVTEIREKVKISDWANSGVYCFPNGDQLAEQCDRLIAQNARQLSQDGVGEFYTSGVIAAMIKLRLCSFRACPIPPDGFKVVGIPAQVAEFCCSRKPKQLRVCFGLDGTLVRPVRAGEKPLPIERNASYLRRLHEQGHHLIVHSSRPASQAGAVAKLLRELRLPCAELAMATPDADIVVDARASGVDPLLGDIDKQLGVYFDPGTEPRATHVAAPVVRGGSGGLRQPPIAAVFGSLMLLFVLYLTGTASLGFFGGAIAGAGVTGLFVRFL